MLKLKHIIAKENKRRDGMQKGMCSPG